MQPTIGQRIASSYRRIFPSGFVLELIQLVRLAAPILFTNMCQQSLCFIPVIFGGHIGHPLDLDGVAMAISVFNATLAAVGQGLATACDTYFSQTFGSGEKKRMGVYLQTSFIIFGLSLLPIIAIHLNIELILRTLGQNPEVAQNLSQLVDYLKLLLTGSIIFRGYKRRAGRYLLILLPGEICVFLYDILTRYIQNQNIMLPTAISAATMTVLNISLHFLFVLHFRLGVEGSALAEMISLCYMFAFIVIYIMARKLYRDTWDGWTWECVAYCGPFGRLAISGLVMSCIEWWAFELGLFATGLLGTIQLAAQSILLQFDGVWFQVPMSISCAITTRVGQYLGANEIPRVKTIIRVAMVTFGVLGLICAALLITFRVEITHIFTNNEEIVSMVVPVVPVIAVYTCFDGISMIYKGILVATGQQTVGMIVIAVSYYVLGLPSGIALMFLTTIGIAAYWYGLAGSLFIQFIILIFLMTRINWDKEVEKATERARGTGGTVSADSGSADLAVGETSPLLMPNGISTHFSSYSQETRELPKAETETNDKNPEGPTEDFQSQYSSNKRRLLCIAVVMITILIGGIICRVTIPITRDSGSNITNILITTPHL